MTYKERWAILGDIGAGGQGRVQRVRKKSSEGLSEEAIANALRNCISTLGGSVNLNNAKDTAARDLITLLRQLSKDNSAAQCGALKILHKPDKSRDPQNAPERITREIEAMRGLSHPNLLPILDSVPNELWFVSPYYRKGALAPCNTYAGDVPRALRSFRDLVAGVALLHENHVVHRDIKPQNIFVSDGNDLVLGDFGLVFFEDDDHTRVSNTFENVGSRDWMPPWAQGVRVKDVKPTFDVYALGKVLWSMVSGAPKLQLWYFERPNNNLELKYKDAPYIALVNPLLRKTVVEEESDCLPNASRLLAEVDKALRIINAGADLINADTKKRVCRVCGVGQYKLIADRGDRMTASNFGLNLGRNTWKVFACEHCGHLQLFAFEEGVGPKAWDER